MPLKECKRPNFYRHLPHARQRCDIFPLDDLLVPTALSHNQVIIWAPQGDIESPYGASHFERNIKAVATGERFSTITKSIGDKTIPYETAD